MRARRLRQPILIIAQIITLLACLGALALGQAPSPTPPPAPATPAGSSWADMISVLIGHAGALIPLLQNELEGPLLPWLERLSWGLAAVVFTFTFARMWRESSGAGADLFWWFGRAVICLALMGSGPALISRLDTIGQAVAWGGNDGRGSVLYKFYDSQRKSFEVGYARFAKGYFTVEPTGENIKPPAGGGTAVLGVLRDVVSSSQGVENKFESLSHDMPFLFSLLSFARGILAFGDLFLLLLGGFLMIAVRLAAPIMIAVAIDRNLAQRMSYPLLWGVIVLTLVWPAVAQLIRAFAYMGGNLAMALDASDYVYQWNPQIMQEIMTSGAEPYHTVILAIVIMTLSGLSLWASPFIAYKVASGQIYESVSSTISGWMGAIVGAGIELYSSSLAASITRQAEEKQAQGHYQSEVTRATAGLERDNLQARASKLIGITGAQGSLTTALAGIEGGRVQQRMGFEAEKQFGLKGVDAQTDLEKSNIWTRKDLSVADLQALQAREGKNIEIDRHNAQLELWGRKINEGSRFAGGVARAVGDGVGDAMAPRSPKAGMLARGGGRVVGGGIEIIGSGADLYLQYRSIENRFAGRTEALNTYTDQAIRNQGAAAGRFDQSQDRYRENIKTANIDRANDLTVAADAGAAISSAGARRGYGITVGGYNQAYSLNLQGNRISYEGAVKAAEQARDAAIEAARLRAYAAVVSSVGHNIARDMEQGMMLRY
jgi:hypothetical protein